MGKGESFPPQVAWSAERKKLIANRSVTCPGTLETGVSMRRYQTGAW
jgi:hypothetical protein